MIAAWIATLAFLVVTLPFALMAREPVALWIPVARTIFLGCLALGATFAWTVLAARAMTRPEGSDSANRER